MTTKLIHLAWGTALTFCPLALHAAAQTQSVPDPGSYSAAMGKPFGAAVPVAVPVSIHLPVQTSVTETTTSGESTLSVSQGEGQQNGSSFNKDDIFAGTEKFGIGATDVNEVNIGPDTLGMVSGNHGGELAHKMNFMVVRSYTYPRPGMYNLADVDAYRQKLRTGNWNCFVHTRDSKSGESTDICSRALPGDQGNEMVIMTVEPKELSFIHLSGKGSLADLSKLQQRLDSLTPPPPPPAPPAPR